MPEPIDFEFELSEAHKALAAIADLRQRASAERLTARQVATAALDIAEHAITARMSRFMGAEIVPVEVAGVPLRVEMPKKDGAQITGWVKQVTGLDRTKRHGYRFLGPFLEFDQDLRLPLGSIVLSKIVIVSPGHSHDTQAAAWFMAEDGQRELIHATGKHWWQSVSEMLSGYLPLK